MLNANASSKIFEFKFELKCENISFAETKCVNLIVYLNVQGHFSEDYNTLYNV